MAAQHHTTTGGHEAAHVTVTSFGYRQPGGAPTDQHLILDVRGALLDPPDAALRQLTGLDEPVRRHVMDTVGAGRLLGALYGTISVMADLGPAAVRVAVGCNGGRHRSVVLAQALTDWLCDWGVDAVVVHRDIDLPVLAPQERQS